MSNVHHYTFTLFERLFQHSSDLIVAQIGVGPGGLDLPKSLAYPVLGYCSASHTFGTIISKKPPWFPHLCVGIFKQFIIKIPWGLALPDFNCERCSSKSTPLFWGESLGCCINPFPADPLPVVFDDDSEAPVVDGLNSSNAVTQHVRREQHGRAIV